MRTSRILKLLVVTTAVGAACILSVMLLQYIFAKVKCADNLALFKESDQVASKLNSRLSSMRLNSDMHAIVGTKGLVEVRVLREKLDVATVLRPLMQDISAAYPIELRCERRLLGVTNNPIYGLTNMAFVADSPYLNRKLGRRAIIIIVSGDF